MMSPTLIAMMPVGALIVGGVIGLGLGRAASNRVGLWALGLTVGACLITIVYLATIGEGEEPRAFAPFAFLTAGLFPVLLSGVIGWVGGRALRRRAGAG